MAVAKRLDLLDEGHSLVGDLVSLRRGVMSGRADKEMAGAVVKVAHVTCRAIGTIVDVDKWQTSKRVASALTSA